MTISKKNKNDVGNYEKHDNHGNKETCCACREKKECKKTDDNKSICKDCDAQK